ncbi:MAG: hypothetical protein KDB27_17850 [Planctomycetales bacterium]|nr:hypothetical protein [Planctomycetales bacterium]
MTERPKLAIVHLILWATASSVYLALLRQYSEFDPSPLGTAKAVSIAMFAGAAISIAGVVVYRPIAGKRWPTAPGEWLGFTVGVSLAVDILTHCFWPARPAIPPEVVIRTIECLATVVPTLSRRLGWNWKLYFIAMVVFQCIAAVLGIGALSSNPVAAAKTLAGVRVSLALTIPLIFTIWERRGEYGWTHWVGVCLNSVWCAILIYST